MGREDWSSIEEVDVPLRQRHLSKGIDQAVSADLYSAAPDTRSKALALSTAIPHAGDWLNVVPSHALGLHLHDWEFRLCLQYWLGLPMVEEGTRCPVCQVAADPYGDHQVGCGGNGDRIHRHDSLRDALFSAAQSAALAPRREVPSLIPGSSSRPADVYFPCWKRGQPAALDVSVISTLQQLTVILWSIYHPGPCSIHRGGEKADRSRSPLPLCWGKLYSHDRGVTWWLEPKSCGRDQVHRSPTGPETGYPPGRLDHPFVSTSRHLPLARKRLPLGAEDPHSTA